MRHYYKSHGKHHYLHSFHSICPKCNVSVLYWEHFHGTKAFFKYPPYVKLVRYICRYSRASHSIKKRFPVVVKKPKDLLEEHSLSCPIYEKSFKNGNSLDRNLKNLNKNDIYHKLFFLN